MAGKLADEAEPAASTSSVVSVPSVVNSSAGQYALLAAFCLLLFGYSAFSGRPLTMHEARLPQTAREMAGRADWRDWIVPTSGGRPWTERPPGPHWVVVAAMSAVRRFDAAWVPRLCSAVVGTLMVLLTAWTVSRLLGRGVGVLAGFLLATAFEFYSYASLAEDDVYLALLVAAALACFVRAEFGESEEDEEPDRLAAPLAGRGVGETRPASGAAKRGGYSAGFFSSFFGKRSWAVVGFFVILGADKSNKGSAAGAAAVGAAAVCLCRVCFFAKPQAVGVGAGVGGVGRADARVAGGGVLDSAGRAGELEVRLSRAAGRGVRGAAVVVLRAGAAGGDPAVDAGGAAGAVGDGGAGVARAAVGGAAGVAAGARAGCGAVGAERGSITTTWCRCWGRGPRCRRWGCGTWGRGC